MALHNFVEMRDHVASRAFLIKKKIAHLMHRMFPDVFVPLYNMVSFSTIPYASAMRRAARQTEILRFVGGALAIVLVILLFLLLRYI